MGELAKAKKLSGGIKVITQSEIDSIIKSAGQFHKYRLPILLNKTFSETPQRFVNCLTSATYVRPHNHTFTGNWELMSWISGVVYVIFFDEHGNVTHKIEMSAVGLKVIEIPSEIYHTFVTPDAGAYLEIRNCAYEPEFDRNYAPWSPSEKSKEVNVYVKMLLDAKESNIDQLV